MRLRDVLCSLNLSMAKKTKAFCCWSGGKDSSLSLYRAKRSGLDISCLVNMISEDGARSRTHGIGAGMIRLQAESMGLPVIQRAASRQGYEEEFKKVLADLRSNGISTGVFGDIDFQVHRDWIERVSADMEVEPVFSLWGEERGKLLDEFLRAGFKTIVVAVQAHILGDEWLGRRIDEEFIRDLKALGTVDLCGENGEYHTFVYDGPVFRKTLGFSFGGKTLQDKYRFLELIPK